VAGTLSLVIFYSQSLFFALVFTSAGTAISGGALAGAGATALGAGVSVGGAVLVPTLLRGGMYYYTKISEGSFTSSQTSISRIPPVVNEKSVESTTVLYKVRGMLPEPGKSSTNPSKESEIRMTGPFNSAVKRNEPVLTCANNLTNF